MSLKKLAQQLNTSPFTATSLTMDGDCDACSIAINDEALLAKQLAMLYTARAQSVLAIIRALDTNTQRTTKAQLLRAISELTPTKAGKTATEYEVEIFKRDGLLFQQIAWLWSAHTHSKSDILCLPQLAPAQHGLDGLIIRGASVANMSVAAVEICEQKATSQPRKTITSKVWPEFAKFETGARDLEIQQQTTSLLSTRAPNIAHRLAERINFEKAKTYRVSITVEPNKIAAGLLQGYDEEVPGERRRRNGEVVLTPKGVRRFLKRIAGQVVKALKLEIANIV